jgi:hypothetical protein
MIDTETPADFDRVERIALASGKPRNLGAISTHQLHAYIDAGRWIVHCPCGSARLTAPNVLFWCADCGNDWSGRAQVPVIFPPEDLIGPVIAALAAWPKVNRGWNPGETIDDIDRQTQQHFAAFEPLDLPPVAGAPIVTNEAV